jgi:hypothetical protein
MRQYPALVRSLPFAFLFIALFCLNSLATEGVTTDVLNDAFAASRNLSASPMTPPTPCSAPNSGGTIVLPANCPYATDLDTGRIENGLPPGSTIEIEIVELSLSSASATEVPGGGLGGTVVQATGDAQLILRGTGGLAGYMRVMNMPISQFLYETAPRTPDDNPQMFQTEMMQLQGQLPLGDPDFDLLRITAGSGFGMPSPGHTTLWRRDATSWAVNSFFDITYRVDFVGAPGGPFTGMSGSTTDSPLHILQGGPFWNPGDTSKMHFPQTPDPIGWDVYAINPRIMGDDFRCIETGPIKDIHFWGSWFNDDTTVVPSFTVSIWSDVPAGIDLPWSHPGTVLWTRNIAKYVVTPMRPSDQGFYEPQSGAWVHPNHKKWYQYDILIDSANWYNQTIGTIYWLTVQANLDPIDTLAGKRWGWKSSTLHYNDDAAYYRTSITGAPCITPDLPGSATGRLPAQCPIEGYGNEMQIIDGLPPGSTIDMPVRMDNMFGPSEIPGGMFLGGHEQFFDIFIELPMTGTGALAGFNRFIPVQLTCETNTGPRGGAVVQSFPHEFMQMQGQIIGDPDFDLLRITGGTNFGMPSPGHTTLTQQPSTDWSVESFFDITYRIDFVGAPGGPLAGMSGSTTGTIRMYIGPTGGAANWQDIYEPPFFTQSLDLAFVITGGVSSCCIGTTGNVNKSALETPDLSDLSLLIAYLTVTPRPTLPCIPEANVNGSAVTTPDLSDLSLLIAYLTVTPRPALPLCP